MSQTTSPARFRMLSMPIARRLPVLRSRLNRWDALILLGFAAFAIFLNLSVWGGRSPYVFLDGDGANIASFCAALDHPELFQGDELLGNPDNFRFYMSVHIPLLRALSRLTGAYGSAYLLMLAPHIFLQALGFYILGRVVFGSRFWALLLAIVSLPTFWLNIQGEFWGVNPTPIPRITYQAVLPFLLAAAYHWRSRTDRWAWVMAGAAALMYVHPVSAPPWAFALWLGFWLYLPGKWSWAKRFGWMFLYGMVFMLFSAPFLLTYLGNHDHGVAANTAQIYQILLHRFTPEYLDAWLAFKGFLMFVLNIQPQTLLLLIIIAPVLLYELNRAGRRELALAGAWTAGLLIVSVLLAGGEQALARLRGATPVQIDLVRNLRFVIPLLLMLAIWSLAELSRRLPSSWGVALLGLAVAGLYVAAYGFHADLNSFLPALRQGRPFTPGESDQEVMRALQAVRDETPPGARILPTALEVPVRYFALRPVVYAWKDGGALAYANHAELLTWYEKDLAFKQAAASGGKAARLAGLSSLAEPFEADYLLVDFEVRPGNIDRLPLEIVYSGKSYALLKVLK